MGNFKNFACVGVVLAFIGLVSPALARPTVYVTSDNLDGTNLFGKLDLETGQFTQIAPTTPLFYGLTVGPEGHLYGADINTGNLFKISKTGATTPFGTVTAPGSDTEGYGYFALVYRNWDDSFLAVNVDPMHVSLYDIGRHGRKQTDLGVIEGPDTGFYFGGSLAIGPRGKLYFDFVPAATIGSANLFTLDESTGAPTAVGTGLGTDYLVLVSDGDKLYGIDGDLTTGIGIYVIDRKTGVAKATGVTVTGLPSTDDFYIDTAAYDPFDHDRCD